MTGVGTPNEVRALIEAVCEDSGHVRRDKRHNYRSMYCQYHPALMFRWHESCDACQGSTKVVCAKCYEPWPCNATYTIGEAVKATLKRIQQ